MSAGLSVAIGLTRIQATRSPLDSLNSASRGRYLRLSGQLVLVIAKTAIFPLAISARERDFPSRSVNVRSPTWRPMP